MLEKNLDQPIQTPSQTETLDFDNKEIIRFPVERLRKFIESAALAQGIQEDHARIFAMRLMEAELRGMNGHGLMRLPQYSKRIQAGGYNLNPDIRAIRETPVSALVEGDNGLGQVVVTFGAELAIRKAKESGMAWVGIRDSNHAGAGGVYAALAPPHDLISMYMAVGNGNFMPAWGGTEKLLSTNPIAYGIPTGEEPPFILDMATTVASNGMVTTFAQNGNTLPEGWIIDKKGKPITDALLKDEGFFLPMGGHKGYGLSLMIGMLGGILNSAAFGRDVIEWRSDFVTPLNTGQAYFAMKPDLFRDLGEFKAEMDRHIREFKSSPRMEGYGPIRVPGDLVVVHQKEMHEKGVPVSPHVLRDVRELACNLNLEDKLDA